MQYGELVRATWTAYSVRWQYLVPLALIGYVAVAVFAVFVTMLAGVIGAVSAIFLFGVASIWIQGLLVRAVDDSEKGECDLRIPARLAAVRPSLNALSVGGIVAGIGVVAGLILLIVPGLVLMTWWALLVPAVVLEGKGPLAALGRSRELVRGHGRLVFNVVLATALLTGIATKVLEYLAGALPASGVVAIVAQLVILSLVAPFTALASAILYYELSESGAQSHSDEFDADRPPSVQRRTRLRPVVRTAVLTLVLALVLGAFLNGRSGGVDPAEKQELVALHNEIVAVTTTARPGSKPHANQAARIAKDAHAWAATHDADPEWEELAVATANFSSLTAAAIMNPNAVAPAKFDAAGRRLQAAATATH